MEAHPAAPKSDGGANRQIVVEGDNLLLAPAFIQKGDTIVINTATAAYDSKVL